MNETPQEQNPTAPTQCRAWAQLSTHAESWKSVHLRELFANDVARSVQFAAAAPGVRLDYSRQRAGAMTLRLLSHLAAERGLPGWREALLSGKKINSTEDRAAWHTALRAGNAAPVEVKEALSRMNALARVVEAHARRRGGELDAARDVVREQLAQVHALPALGVRGELRPRFALRWGSRIHLSRAYRR